MNKGILVISYVPTHPINAGNRARTYNLLKNIQKIGYKVYFLYIRKDQWGYFREGIYDARMMKNCWDSLFIIGQSKNQNPQTNKYKITYSLLLRLLEKFLPSVCRLLVYVKNKLFDILSIDRKLAIIDNEYSAETASEIRKIIKKISFSYVICNYVFASSFLKLFGKKILKIIDTHENITEIYSSFSGYSGPDVNILERKAINRADVVIAIQDKEKEYFSRLAAKGKKTIGIGHIVDLYKPDPKRALGKNILFIAACWRANYIGINDFIANVLPELKSREPGLNLIVAGKVCTKTKDSEGCIKIGPVKDVGDAYRMADIVINPVNSGPGLKIKSIEALGYAKPLVACRNALIGLESGIGKAFMVADKPSEFIDAIIKVLSDKNLYLNLSNAAYQFADKYNQKQLSAIREMLSVK